jgi:hypothetical protein
MEKVVDALYNKAKKLTWKKLHTCSFYCGNVRSGKCEIIFQDGGCPFFYFYPWIGFRVSWPGCVCFIRSRFFKDQKSTVHLCSKFEATLTSSRKINYCFSLLVSSFHLTIIFTLKLSIWVPNWR